MYCIIVLGVLPAHLPTVLDAGTVLVSVPQLKRAGFVYSHWPSLRRELGDVRQYTR